MLKGGLCTSSYIFIKKERLIMKKEDIEREHEKEIEIAEVIKFFENLTKKENE